MDNENSGTYFNAPSLTALSLDELASIMRNFEDRMPATVKEIRIHPHYMPVFLANLREEGFFRKIGPAGLGWISIIGDGEVPFGEFKYVYFGDSPEP